MSGILIAVSLVTFFMTIGFVAQFVVFEKVTFGKVPPASVIKAIMLTVIGICASSLLFAGGKAVSDYLWGVDEQLAVDSESDTGSIEGKDNGGENVDSGKEDPGAGGGSSESGPPVWVIGGIGGGILSAVATTVVAKRVQRRRRKREAWDADFAFVESRLATLSERIGRVSAEYAQAHVDPEVVLYKPLLIGSSDEAYEFVDAMADAQLAVESDEKWLKSVGSSPVDRDCIKGTEDKVRRAEQLWRRLNRKAEQVGTPILDADVLRRAERLWGLATNEAATVSERRSAMGKLEELVSGCRRELSQQDIQSRQLCDVISAQIARGKTQGIIDAPGPVVPLPGASVLALEKK